MALSNLVRLGMIIIERLIVFWLFLINLQMTIIKRFLWEEIIIFYYKDIAKSIKFHQQGVFYVNNVKLDLEFTKRYDRKN